MEPSASRETWVIEDPIYQKLQGARIVGALVQAGFEARYLSLDEGDALSNRASSTSPLLILHSVLFAHRLDEHLSLAAGLRQLGVPSHHTIAGQLPAVIHADLLRRCPALDSVVCGDAESVVPALAHHLRSGSSWAGVPGLASRASDGKVISTAPSAAQLDDLPPIWRPPIPQTFSGYGFATIEASRGCYHVCTFCLPSHYYRHIGTPYRLRSVPNLMQEIQDCYSRGVRLFLFDDDQFLAPGNLRYMRVSQFGSELKRRKLEIAFTIKCRADDVEVSLFRQLKQIGLIRVYLGIESGHQSVLDAFDKRVTPEKNLTALAILNELGIVADFRSLLFHPLSTLEILTGEIRFLERVMPHVSTLLDFREVEVYPGTLFARSVSENDHSGFGPIHYRIPDSNAELIRRCSRAIFSSSGPFGRAKDNVTQTWFRHLLKERFAPTAVPTESRGAIQLCVSRLNGEALGVWQEILEFVEKNRTPTAHQINARVGAWWMRLQSAAVQAEGLLQAEKNETQTVGGPIQDW